MKQIFYTSIHCNLKATMKNTNVLKHILLTMLFMSTLYLSASAQNVTIPDSNFKSYLVTNFDENSDGEIQPEEAEAVSFINANSQGISDVTGIEAFVNLTRLFLNSNSLTSVDVSANTKLSLLLLNDNSISTIDVSSNLRLINLSVNNNALTTLDLSTNSSLLFLSVEGNQLASLDLSAQSSSLIFLSVGNNPGTTSFDISGLNELVSLTINSSSLSSLDISANANLTTLVATDNPSLTCVVVADPYYHWIGNATLDGSVVFTDNCSNPLVVIPDAAMSSALLAHNPDIDTNDDGEIRADEAAAFTGTLSLASLGIEDATGIEAFINATSIDLSDNSLFRLNLDANTALTSADLFENDLHYFSIKNGNNTAITSLDVSDNDNLECMSVNDLTHANANWTFPLATSLSTDCAISFADTDFKNALLAHSPIIDLNDDDEISVSEAEAMIGRMSIYNKSISDLSGIAAFSNINSLIAGLNDLTSVDLSQNTNLVQVTLDQNDLTSLTLGDNEVVNSLTIYDNQLTSLDVSSYTSLRTLVCNTNNLASLSVPSQLTSLSFGGNPVSSSFDYTGLTELIVLSASGTSIPTPDVSNLVNLQTLICSGCEMDEIDLSSNTKLTAINLTNNNLESLDLSSNPLITNVGVSGNSLTSLDVSNMPDLTIVNASGNELVSLNVNNGTTIGDIRAYNNPDLQCISANNPDFAGFFSNVDEGVVFYEDCNSIPIDFPDDNFEQALLSHSPSIDTDSDGVIRTDEAANFSGALDVSGQSITDPTGLVFFENATSIDLSSNNMKWFISSIEGLSASSIDFSNNQLALVKFSEVDGSSFSSLTFDNNPNLICVNVDDLTYANANWTVSGSGVSVSDDCNVSIPNAVFKADLAADNTIDTNDDDEIQLSEAEAFTGTIFASSSAITDLTGIEAFPNLNYLDVNGTLTEVDVSRNTKLTTLILDMNELSSIDVSNNTMLTRLELNNNDLTALDVSSNVQLDHLNVMSNDLESIDLSENGLLTFVELRFNVLESLDIKNGNNAAVTTFRASSNDLACLNVDDISHFQSNFSDDVDSGVIFDTNCNDPLLDITDANFLAALVGYSPSFDANTDGDIRRSEVVAFSGTLDVSSSSISSLSGIEDFTNLTGLDANDNQIADLDVSENELLTYLDASDNDLESLDVRNDNNENFTFFDVTGNSLLSCIEVDDVNYSTTSWTSKDAGASFARFCDPDEAVYIPDYRLEDALDASDTNDDNVITYGEADAFTGDINIGSLVESLEGLQYFPNINRIRYVNSNNNNIQYFDFSKNLGLKELVLSTIDGAYSTVDIGQNTELIELSLGNVDITNLDLTIYPDLEILSLYEFDLGTIDLSANTSLVELRLQDMGLTSLDLSTNTLLEELHLFKTPLTSLDLTNNSAIIDLNISETDISTIDVSHLADLEEFRAEEGSLISLDVSQNNKLYILYAAGDQSESEGVPSKFGTLTEVYLPATATLEDIDLYANRIASINLPGLNNASLDMNLRYNGLEEITIASIPGANASIDLDHNSLLTINATQVQGGSASVSVTNNLLVEANLGAVNFIDLSDNPDLDCAFVFDPSNASTEYDYDEGLTFSNVSCNITWDGSAWSNGSGPTASDDVLILGDYDFATDGSFECTGLRVHGLATLLVDNQGTLQVNGEFRNNGSTIIASGASLITFDANEFIDNAVEVRRNTRYLGGQYSFVGTPVGQDASMVGSDLGSSVYKYNEVVDFDSDGINRWEDASSDQLVPGKGYTQAFQQEIIFSGVPNDGTITYNGTYTEDDFDVNEGWNLVANPYAAAINVTSFLTENDHISGSVYIWDDNGSNSQRGSNDDYIVANGTMATSTQMDVDANRYNDHLGSAQGFFVKFDDNSNTDIIFNENMRVSGENDDDNFFRETQLPITRINLTDDQGLFRQTVIGYADDANENELNKIYDAQAFNASADYGLFTMKAGRSLSLNGMTQDWEAVQLQLNVEEEGEYEISVQLENYDNDLYLRDNETGKVTDLGSTSYSFTAKAGINTDRFVLISSPTGVLGVEEKNVLIYASNGILHIQQSSEKEREYQLFNMRGKQLLSKPVRSSEEINLSSYAKGIYLVFDGQKTHKIILD